MLTPKQDFWHMNEEKTRPYFAGLFDILNLWTEKDKRGAVSPSQDGIWLILLLGKKLRSEVKKKR